MDREIFFLGKRLDNGKWIKGFYMMFSTSITHPYSYTNGDHYILTVPHNIKYQVDPKTICQYTGFKDNERKEIYEKAIIKDIETENIGIVQFKNGCFKIEWVIGNKRFRDDLFFWANEKCIEVIGNIFDNADLIQKV